MEWCEVGKRKQYSDDFRADCVLMLEAAGYPDKEGALTAVSKKVKVPARTISRWFKKEQNPPPDQLVNEKKGLLVDELESLAYRLVGAMGGEIDNADLRELATTFGIVVDKWQLLSGEPTDRQEVNVRNNRDRTLARLAADAGGYVTPRTDNVGQLPN